MTLKPYVEAREQITRSSSVRFWFSRFATRAAQAVGHPYVFFAAVATLVVWGLTGRYFHYSDTWQLVINTGTSVITFLVVFLIQNTQNRDAKAIHLKLDELIRSHHPASDDLIDVEKLSDEELDALEKQYERIRKETEARRSGRTENSAA